VLSLFAKVLIHIRTDEPKHFFSSFLFNEVLFKDAFCVRIYLEKLRRKKIFAVLI
jgi:hypothetical protein